MSSAESEAAAIESVVRSRLSVVQDASTTVVAACASWIGVYSSVAPAVIVRVWCNMLTDADNGDTDQRVGLLAVMHESLKNCARRSGSDDVIRKYVLAVRKEVPTAITTTLTTLEKSDTSNNNNNEFRKACHQALSTWRNFTGFFPSQWLEKTIASVSSTTSSKNAENGEDAAASSSSANQQNNNSNQQQQSGGGGLAAATGIDPLAAESSGLSEILRLFQKYNSSLERLRRYEADASTSASTIESVRDDVIHRAKPLLAKLGSSGGAAGFIPNIEGEVKRLQQQQQQTSTAVPEDAADPLEDFFA